MTILTFFTSTVGKIVMVVTTIVAGIVANFIGASMVEDDLKETAIRRGAIDGGANADAINNLSREQLYTEWDMVKQIMENNPDLKGQDASVYVNVNSYLDKVPLESHFSTFPIILTISVIAIFGIIWFIVYRMAKKRTNENTV